MTIVDGGVLFSDKSGFDDYSARFMFQYSDHLWYLIEWQERFGRVAISHLSRMKELLEEHVLKEFEADTPSVVSFRNVLETTP